MRMLRGAFTASGKVSVHTVHLSGFRRGGVWAKCACAEEPRWQPLVASAAQKPAAAPPQQIGSEPGVGQDAIF